MTNDSVAIPTSKSVFHQTVQICDKCPEKAVLHDGRCYKCVRKSKVCAFSALSLLAITSGAIIEAVITPLSIDSGNDGNYGLMTALIIANLGGLILIIGGGYKSFNIFCQLREENQMYPVS